MDIPSSSSSLERRRPPRRGRRNSSDLGSSSSESPPRKPPRTFAYNQLEKPKRSSIFNLFKKSGPKETPKKSNLRRSVSDATNLKSKAFKPQHEEPPRRRRSGSESDENGSNVKTKKQLSPIIESAPSEDYFSKKKDVAPSVTEQLKEYIDEVDTALFHETGIKVEPTETKCKPTEVIIIDVDQAEKISKNKKSKTGGLKKKLKALTSKKSKIKKKTTPEGVSVPITIEAKPEESSEPVKVEVIPVPDTISASERVREAIRNLENSTTFPPTMIHSSQQPVERLPLTRGLKVDSMVKRLSVDKTSPPPPVQSGIVHSPNVSLQHNNNQPFSYTRGLSPERYRSPEGHNPGSPIIYAHVVCDKNSSAPSKQTVHAAYTNGNSKKQLPHSDSDEGLGYEEHTGVSRKYDNDKLLTHFGDDRRNFGSPFKDIDQFEEESPITPKFKNIGFNGYTAFDTKFNNSYKTQHNIYIDSSSRGRGDGMDSKRRESLSEAHENGFGTSRFNGSPPNINPRADLSARRDLLESRINRRLGEKGLRQSPAKMTSANYVTEKTSKYHRHGSSSPVGFTEKYSSETVTDRDGLQRKSESRSRETFGVSDRIGQSEQSKINEYRYNSLENEPKSFDSQVSDYRSSPENLPRHYETSHDYRYVFAEIVHIIVVDAGSPHEGCLVPFRTVCVNQSSW